jgi:hypothetical protein
MVCILHRTPLLPISSLPLDLVEHVLGLDEHSQNVKVVPTVLLLVMFSYNIGIRGLDLGVDPVGEKPTPNQIGKKTQYLKP